MCTRRLFSGLRINGNLGWGTIGEVFSVFVRITMTTCDGNCLRCAYNLRSKNCVSVVVLYMFVNPLPELEEGRGTCTRWCERWERIYL
jgi:hypothetical protein